MEPTTNTTANQTTTPSATPGRDANGRFGKGNHGGPGNPFARRTAKLRQAALAAVSPGDIREIFQVLKDKARQGDVPAIKLLLAYTVGTPTAATDPDTLASYLASQAVTLSVATLVRRLAAIAKAHRSHGLASPTTAEIVKATMRGIRRTNGAAQREAIRTLFRIMNRYVGNLPPMPGVFPDYPAPVVRNAGVDRDLTMMRWGMPPPPKFGGPPVTNSGTPLHRTGGAG